MRILFIASGQSVPSTRFRILPYLPLLREAGHHCDVAFSFPQKYDHFRWLGWRASQFLKRSVRRWHAFLAARRKYDAIFIEREVFDDDTWDIEQRLRQSTSRLVLDVDDGVHLLHPKKFAEVAKMCDAAIAGNRYLQDELRPYCDDVSLIPTCVRLADYPLKPARQEDAPLTIGWIGTTHNVLFLNGCAAALREAAKSHDFRLLIVATNDQRLAEVDLQGVHVEFRNWSPEREIADLHEMDIGLMPLPADEPWMKFKCGLKLIQYLAVGTPGIASPIGINAEILEGDRVGRAASNHQQWLTAINELLCHATLRDDLGMSGRALVESQFSIEGNWRRLESILSS